VQVFDEGRLLPNGIVEATIQDRRLFGADGGDGLARFGLLAGRDCGASRADNHQQQCRL